jgi:DNA replication protein DnaC
MVNEQINSMSYKLRLFGVQANFEKRAQQALARTGIAPLIGKTHLAVALGRRLCRENMILASAITLMKRLRSLLISWKTGWGEALCEPQGWLKLFEDPVIAEAIVDRLLNPSQKITLRGGSYREKLKPLLPTQKKLAANGAPR